MQCLKYIITIIAETICPITVATAAPAILKSITDTNNASKIVLITAPVRLHSIVNLGLPSALIRCPPPVASIRNGKPIAVILV